VLTRLLIQTIWILNCRFKFSRNTTPSVTHATLSVGIFRLSVANPTNTSNNNYNILINQKFISVCVDSETEWPIIKSAQLQKKCHKQTEVRQEKFMCNENEFGDNRDGAYQYITHLRQQCHNSKCVIFQERLLNVLKCYNFLWVQRRHICCSAANLQTALWHSTC